MNMGELLLNERFREGLRRRGLEIKEIDRFKNVRGKLKKYGCEEKVEEIKYLSLACNEIEDVREIFDLVTLERLDLQFNRLRNISGIGKLGKLIYLNLYANGIEDISEIIEMRELVHLDVGINKISMLPELPISLNKVYLGRNEIKDITSLAGLVNLKRLDLGRNEIKDISALMGLGNITKLVLRGNKIEEAEIVKLQECLPDCDIC